MKIKDEYELANILGTAFSRHANDIQNGAVGPYICFLSGTESIDMTITLSGDGTITVKPIVHPEDKKTEPINLFSELPGVMDS